MPTPLTVVFTCQGCAEEFQPNPAYEAPLELSDSFARILSDHVNSEDGDLGRNSCEGEGFHVDYKEA